MHTLGEGGVWFDRYVESSESVSGCSALYTSHHEHASATVANTGDGVQAKLVDSEMW